MATSFQYLQTWRNLNVPRKKLRSIYFGPDSKVQRNTSETSPAGSLKTRIWGIWLWIDLSLLFSLKRKSIRFFSRGLSELQYNQTNTGMKSLTPLMCRALLLVESGCTSISRHCLVNTHYTFASLQLGGLRDPNQIFVPVQLRLKSSLDILGLPPPVSLTLE